MLGQFGHLGGKVKALEVAGVGSDRVGPQVRCPFFKEGVHGVEVAYGAWEGVAGQLLPFNAERLLAGILERLVGPLAQGYEAVFVLDQKRTGTGFGYADAKTLEAVPGGFVAGRGHGEIFDLQISEGGFCYQFSTPSTWLVGGYGGAPYTRVHVDCVDISTGYGRYGALCCTVVYGQKRMFNHRTRGNLY